MCFSSAACVGIVCAQHVMGGVAEGLIDQFTNEAIQEKIVEERNSGRATGSGEFGADLWVEAMVSSVNSNGACLL